MVEKKGKPHVVTLRIPIELNKKLDVYLQTVGASKNSYILTLLAKDLERNNEHCATAERPNPAA